MNLFEDIGTSRIILNEKYLYQEYSPTEIFNRDKEINQIEAKRLFVSLDLNLAKRQRTWFKRNKSIQWVANREEAVELVTTFLNK